MGLSLTPVSDTPREAPGSQARVGSRDREMSDERERMDEHKESELPGSLANGRLEGVSVPDLLWNICRRRSTGVLNLTAQGVTKRVYIDGGRIVFALSSDPDDRLGGLLLREESITLDQFESAAAKLPGGKRLGTILVDAGHLSPESLVRGVLNQVKSIVLALFPWDEGEYAFVEGPLPTEEVISLGMRTGEILLQGIRQVRSFSRIRKSVGPVTARFRLDTDWRDALDGLDIRDGERMLLKRLDDAGPRGVPVDAMCREVFLSNFEIYQALWAFLVLGIVREVEGGSDSAIGAGIEGRIEGGGLPEILVRLCRSEVTGVLHMTRGTLERTLHIANGQCVFATSTALDDGLVAHLLRRGVISLTDREETARRLLSNKRVGAILLEMGVIDAGDLRVMVRDQLSEIIFDTFRWDRGEFRFVEGPPSVVEEITLTRTVEDLLVSGVRRVTSLSRVSDGCGGVRARLTLLPEYLAVLDKMTAGPEEWELISLLKTPKSVLEICRESVLGDFRSCQILWALRLLGAIGEAPVDVSVDSALDRLDEARAAEPTLEEAFEHPAAVPEPEAAQLPLSEADPVVDYVSEPWRLAADRAPEKPADADPVAFQFDSPADATIAIPREDVEAALRGSEVGLPHFEFDEPGTSVEDMKVDMRPSPSTPSPQPPDTAETTAAIDAGDSGFDRAEPAKSHEPPQRVVGERPFEPPFNLVGTIASFNARHVVLFRAVRSEIGAGAANFVRSCRLGLDNEFAEMFASAELRADGSWDPEMLKRSVIGHRVARAEEGCQRLLDAELSRLRAHLGDARAGSLAVQLSSIP